LGKISHQRAVSPGKRHAQINRNLMNFPISRDVRVTPEWLIDDEHGRRECALPGNSDIHFRMPLDAKCLRCPTPFDVNVLLLILQEAHINNCSTVKFRSRSQLIKMLGLSCHMFRQRRRLDKTLTLLSSMSIRYRQWYYPGKWQHGLRGKRATKILPPPIKVISDGRPLVVKVSQKWREICHRYFVPVQLPLPMNAAAQNLVLNILTSAERDGDGIKVPRSIRRLCRAIGLNHHDRKDALTHVIGLATVWFHERGLRLDHAERYGRMSFILDKLGMQTKPAEITSKPKKKESLPRVRLDAPEEWVDDHGNRGWHQFIGGKWQDCPAPSRGGLSQSAPGVGYQNHNLKIGPAPGRQ
jgi:hypothetical protein